MEDSYVDGWKYNFNILNIRDHALETEISDLRPINMSDRRQACMIKHVRWVSDKACQSPIREVGLRY